MNKENKLDVFGGYEKFVRPDLTVPVVGEDDKLFEIEDDVPALPPVAPHIPPVVTPEFKLGEDDYKAIAKEIALIMKGEE